MSGKFNSVIFDLDGTLIDSAPGILQSFAVAFEKNGKHHGFHGARRSSGHPCMRSSLCNVDRKIPLCWGS